jgi:hypothetical protein
VAKRLKSRVVITVMPYAKGLVVGHAKVKMELILEVNGIFFANSLTILDLD